MIRFYPPPRPIEMARMSLLLVLLVLILAGCNAVESGYEGNREKQNAKTEKALGDAENQ